MAGGKDDLALPSRQRVQTPARATAAGFAVAVIGVLVAVATGIPARRANGLVFPLAALLFGFGLATWASALLYGSTIDRQASRWGLSEGFSSEGTAEAMGVLTMFGFGGMVGGTLATVATTSVGM